MLRQSAPLHTEIRPGKTLTVGNPAGHITRFVFVLQSTLWSRPEDVDGMQLDWTLLFRTRRRQLLS
jgi:hypothetical protein